MAIRDVLVLNTTASRAETQQGSDTVAIRGNSGEALSVENSSGTSILSVNTVSSSVDVAGKITATTNVSSSLSSTGSFGRLEATTLVGDAFNLTGTAIDGTISSSGQIANQISGSFRRGFEFTGTIGDTIPDQENRITASFGRIVATSLSGSAANLTNTDLDNTISGSAQIASQISGAFDSGFEFTGTISGSATSTGSFGRVVATTITGDVRNMTNIVKAGLISGSGQIASRISGSFNRGFEFSGEISGSATSTGSLGKFVANKAVGDISGMTNILPTGTVSSSAQLATAISGAFDAGFEFTGTISGSATSTGSFSHLVATTITGDVSGMSNLIKTGFLSSSAQLATSISGSFNKGFEFSGHISGSGASTGSFGRVEATSISGDISNLTNTTIAGTISSSGQIASYISGSFNKGFEFTGNITSKAVVFSSGGDLNCAPGAAESGNVVGSTYRGAAGNKNAGLVFGGFRYSGYKYIGNTEEYNGTSWSEVNDMIDAGSAAGGGTSEAAIATGGSYRNCDTEEWNGTNWSEVNHQISDKTCTYKPLSIGNSSEALITAGGNNTAPYGQTESWNGTNWSATTAMIHDPRGWHGGAGTQNAGLTAGGPHGSNTVSCTETWNGLSWTEGASALISNMKIVSMAGSQNDTLLAGHAQGSSFNGNIFGNPANFSECSICWDGIVWSTSTDLGSRRLGMSAAGSNSDVGFFAGGIDISSPHSFACTIESETFVASASFSHIEATKITASVDGMTNIDPPTDAISGSAQIASNISGSFNKGFEFDGELRSLGVWTSGADFTGCFQSTYSKLGYSAIGTRDAAIVAGASGVYQVWVSETYAYNGVAWSDTGHHMIQGGSHSAHGTANAGLAIGRHSRAPGTGYFYTCTEEYNGSAWSETTDLPYTLKNLNNQSAGTQNAALTAGGNCDTGNDLDAIKRHALAWDGLSYSHVGTLAEARDSAALTGTVNAALAQGGGSDSSTNDLASDSTCTEEWNGSAWSTAAASNFPTGCGVMASGKSSNDSMHVYDASNASLKSDVYNGMTWNLGPNMNGTGRIQDYGAAGTTGRSFFMARVSSAVEHFDENHVTSSIGRVDANELSLESNTDLTVNESLQIPQYATNPPVTGSAGEVWYNTAEEKLYFTYDINTWSEVADMNTDKSNSGAAACNHGDAIIAGGRSTATPNLAITEVWDGNAWSETNDLNLARRHLIGTGYGSNSAIVTGGFVNTTTNDTEEWNGTNWTEVVDNTYSYAEMQMSGTSNAAMSNGGVQNSPYAEQTGTAEWNGTSWSAAAARSVAVAAHGGAGSQNSAITFGGEEPGTNELTCTEEYNGTNWATGIPLLIAANSNQGSGTQNAAMSSGTQTSPYNQTQEYNGSAWSQTANLTAGLKDRDGGGSQSSTVVMGGDYGTGASKTEQYTTTGIGCHCIGGV